MIDPVKELRAIVRASGYSTGRTYTTKRADGTLRVKIWAMPNPIDTPALWNTLNDCAELLGANSSGWTINGCKPGAISTHSFVAIFPKGTYE